MKILLTGSAGFIGYHVAKKMLDNGYKIFGLDNLNDYYDVNLKKARIASLQNSPDYTNLIMDIGDFNQLNEIFEQYRPERIIHLAAQPGVRHSLKEPRAYINSNIYSFLNILEASRNFSIKHLVYASTSSVYGSNTRMPFSEDDRTDHPTNLYAASKKSNELMAHSYSHLFSIPVTGLRFFTVYGPWGRPDMAPLKFTKAILEGSPIDVYNNGNMARDFTYIDDIVEGIVLAINKIPEIDPLWDSKSPNPSSSGVAPYKLYNIGNNKPVNLMDFIEILETALNKKAIINFMAMQPGDIQKSWADSNKLIEDIKYTPSTSIEEGVKKLTEWYINYYKVTQ